MPLLRGFILYTHTPSVCQLRLYLFSASVIISVSTFFQLKLAPKFCDVRTFQHTETVDTHTHTPNTKKKKEKKKINGNAHTLRINTKLCVCSPRLFLSCFLPYGAVFFHLLPTRTATTSNRISRSPFPRVHHP